MPAGTVKTTNVEVMIRMIHSQADTSKHLPKIAIVQTWCNGRQLGMKGLSRCVSKNKTTTVQRREGLNSVFICSASVFPKPRSTS